MSLMASRRVRMAQDHLDPNHNPRRARSCLTFYQMLIIDAMRYRENSIEGGVLTYVKGSKAVVVGRVRGWVDSRSLWLGASLH
jgi:hypothetical protein